MKDKKIIVVGGPFSQNVDPVMKLVPSGSGKLASAIADEFEKNFTVERIGNFSSGQPNDIFSLETRIKGFSSDAVIFFPHLPNFLVECPSEGKIRIAENEVGCLTIRRAPKLVALVKKYHPGCLLVPFKLADKDTSVVEIVKWMLELHAGLAVYSRLEEKNYFYIIDALGNRTKVTRDVLPEALVEKVNRILSGTRRSSCRIGDKVPDVPLLGQLTEFSRKMRPAFSQIIEKNVASGRWPGNFSFRCTHGFLSVRDSSGFVITKRDVDKTGLTEKDFVWVRLDLHDDKLIYSGAPGTKPSVDAPVHRLIYKKLPWVKVIVHGHLQVSGEFVHGEPLPLWPCGAENEADDIMQAVPKDVTPSLWIANVTGHGFVALIGDSDPKNALDTLSALNFF
jgi:hypothetical protein